MNTTLFIILFILLGFASFAGFIWQMKKIKLQESKQRKKSDRGKRRRSDISNLNSKDKKIYKRAKGLVKERRFTQAAQLLESIQMQREAINVLENAGLIHEAAKILMRMGLHNRAGVVYARNKYWERAAESFRYANMPFEAAKCAMEFGNEEMAAEQFELAERFEEAGDLHSKLGNSLKASKLYMKIGDIDSAVKLFSKLIEFAKDEIPFDNQEVRFMAEWMKKGNFDENIADVISESPRLIEVLLELLLIEKADVALKLYQKSETGTGSQLLSKVDYENKAMWQELIKLFLLADEFNNAGVVFENKNKYKEAAEAFERGNDLVRSAHCFDRAGLQDRAQEIRVKQRKNVEGGNIPPPPGGSPFSISSVASYEEKDEDKNISKSAVVENKAPADIPVPQFNSANEEVSKQVYTGDIGEFSNQFQLSQLPKACDKKELDEDHHDSFIEPDAFQGLEKNDEMDQYFKSEPPKLVNEESSSIELKSIEESTKYNDVREESKIAAMMQADKDAFKQSNFMSVLEEYEKDKLWLIGKDMIFKKGDLILDYNQEPAGAYFILNGQVSCYRINSKGQDKHLDVMEKAKSFGELWLLADHPTEVKFIAHSNCKLRVIARDEFNALLDQDGVIARKLYKKFTGRLVSSLVKPYPRRSNIKKKPA